MSNMLLKTMIGSISQSGSGDLPDLPELPKGSGTQSDPYNWYRILDQNNPNGCHTEWINQNADEGWIKVKLEGGVTYSIGQSYYDEDGNSFDGYLYLYDSNFNNLQNADGTDVPDIDGFTQLDASTFLTPNETGYYYIKAASFNENYPDRKVTIHCQPAPINEGGSGGDSLLPIDEDCYVIEIEVYSTSDPIQIDDCGYGEYNQAAIIDWGDGTLEKDTEASTFYHYYNEPGTYKIIWKTFSVQSANQIGASNTSNFQVKNIIHLPECRMDFNNLFNNCNFESYKTYEVRIPERAGSLIYTFASTRGFYNINFTCDSTNISSVDYMFWNSEVKSVIFESGMLSNVGDTSTIFEGCNYLEFYDLGI